MVEIIIQPDGTMLIPRGDSAENKVYIELCSDMLSASEQSGLVSFLNYQDQFTQIFGETGLCG